MKKSFHSTLVLLAVFAGLVTWYLVYEKKIKPAQTEKEENAKVLLSMDRESVQELTVLQRQGDEKSDKYRTLRFKKAGTDWNIVEPLQDAAELGAVSGLVSTLVSVKQDRVVDEKPASLEPFGLTHPKLKMTARKDSTSPPVELWVGNDTPTGSSVYAKVVGSDVVYRAPQTLRTSFDKDVAEYRNKKILSLNRTDVRELEVRTGDGSFVLQRPDGSEKWLLAREGLPANDTEVNKTLNTVLDMRATAFAHDKATDLAKWGLAPAAVTLTFKKANGQTLVSFGKVKDKCYAKRGDTGVVYEIPKDVFEKASRPAKDYRDLKIANFNRFDVKRFKIEHGPESFELVKDTAEWKLASDPKVRIDTTKVDDYLSRLQDVKVAGYVAADRKPKAPDLVIHLFEKKGDKESETVTLKIAKPAGKQSVGSREGLESAFTLDETEFKKLNAFKQEFLANEKQVENKTGNGKS